MKKATLFLASLLFATSSFAQYLTPEEVPISKDFKLVDCWGLGTIGNKLIITGNTITNKELKPFGPFLQYDGISPIQETPNNIIQNVKVGNLSKIDNPPYGKYYFNGWGTDTGGVYTWDGINPVEKIVSHNPNSSGFSKGVGIGSKVYYVQHVNGGDRQSDLWVVDVEKKTLKKLTNKQYHIAQLKVYKGKIYFFEYYKPNYLHCYDPETGQFTDINTGLDANEKTYTYSVNVVGDKLAFVLHTATLGMELYSYNGEGSVHLIKDLGKGKLDGVSSNAALYHGKLYFAANEALEDKETFRHLYRYDPISEEITVAKRFEGKEPFLGIPHHFSVAFDKLYFTARSSEENGLQLHEYNDATDELKQLTNMPKRDEINFYPMSTIAWGDYLYFIAYTGKDVMGFKNRKYIWENGIKIYRVKPEQKPTTIGHTFITTLRVTAHPNPTSGNTTLSITLDKAQTIAITLTDVSGRIVYTKAATQYNNGQHTVPLPTQSLTSGLYFIQLTNKNGTLLNSGKLVKK